VSGATRSPFKIKNMKPLKRNAVPLPKFGIRKKMIPRKFSKPLEFIRDTKEKPDAGKIFIRKQEKTVYETKEEKHQPEETKSFIDVPISKLKTMNGGFTKAARDVLLKDERVSAVRLAQEELKKREG
jgi:hypothetical protein